MSRAKRVKVQAFSVVTCQDMEYYVNPIIAKKPDHVIVHIATNDFHQDRAPTIAKNINKLVEILEQNNMTCSVSSVITRQDETEKTENSIK